MYVIVTLKKSIYVPTGNIIFHNCIIFIMSATKCINFDAILLIFVSKIKIFLLEVDIEYRIYMYSNVQKHLFL